MERMGESERLLVVVVNTLMVIVMRVIGDSVGDNDGGEIMMVKKTSMVMMMVVMVMTMVVMVMIMVVMVMMVVVMVRWPIRDMLKMLHYCKYK
jgi:hypothetical protein